MDTGSGPVVEIPQGKLQGKKDKSVLGQEFYCFHRIPYAKPPVGELRFKAPQPADGWSGIRDATYEGGVSPSPDWQRKFYLPHSSEDSLYLNVYCKQIPENKGGKKTPVMVWIHGGGFEVGTGNRDMCGPDYFMQHDVVLVTFNYRLGVLGFLSLQTLECPGNFGLKDQQLALRWVKDNIVHFGGDPENITIFGVSAGGASVHYQTLSEKNKGLFKRAIAQSASAINRWAYARRPRENAFLLGKRLGCDTKDDKVLLDFLKAAKPEDLVMKGVAIMNDTEGPSLGEFFINFTFVPTTEPEHEGAFATKHPWILLKEGRGLDVPFVTGLTSKEMILGVQSKDDYPRLDKVEEFQALIPRDIQLEKNSDRALTVAKKIKDFYFQNGVNLENYMDELSDTFFNYGVLKTVKNRCANKTKFKSPTYLYQFSYEGDQPFIKNGLGLGDIKGSCHADDFCYLFRTLFSNMDKMTPGSRDYKFVEKFTKLWVKFATTGVPSLDEPAIQWTPASSDNFEYLDLDEKFSTGKGLFKNRFQFWEDLYTSYYDGK